MNIIEQSLPDLMIRVRNCKLNASLGLFFLNPEKLHVHVYIVHLHVYMSLSHCAMAHIHMYTYTHIYISILCIVGVGRGAYMYTTYKVWGPCHSCQSNIYEMKHVTIGQNDQQ